MTQMEASAIPKSSTLDNGMRVILESHPWRRNAAVGILVHTGARDEPAGQDGISHFLEHLCYKGTPNRSAEQINLSFDEMGANINAFTSEDATCYYAYVPTESVSDAVEILFDMMRSSLPRDEVEHERGVVLEEIAMYKDLPQYLVWDEAILLAYKGQPLGRSVLGSDDSVKSLTVDQIGQYQRSRYTPQNLTFISTGNFDAKPLLDQVQELASKLEPGAKRRDFVNHAVIPGKKFVVQSHREIQHVSIALSAPAAGDPLFPVASALEWLLGDDFGSIYFNTIMRKGLAQSADASYIPYSDAGLFFLTAATKEENASEVVKLLLDGIMGVAQNGVDDDFLDRARRKLTMSEFSSAETPMSRFERLIVQDSGAGELMDVDRQCDLFRSVNAASLVEYFKRYPVSESTYALTGVGPADDVVL